MAVDVTLNTISSGYNLSKINENFNNIQEALQDSVSRSGNGPNQMNADIDMNNNDLLNVGVLDASDVTIDGQPATGVLQQAAQAAAEAAASADEAEQSASDAAFSASSAASSAALAASIAQINFNTVAQLLADNDLSYNGENAVEVGQIITAQGFRYEVAASDATDNDVETAGAVKLYVLPDGNGWLPFKAFGPAGDGSTDDGPKLLAAMTAAINRGIPTVALGIGEYAINSKITVPGPLEIRGTNEWQHGSNRPATVLVWTGGADSMFTYASSGDRWIGFAILNKGMATDFIEYTSGAILHYFEDVSSDLPTGYTAFSRSIIRSTGHRLGYSLFWHLNITGGCAPSFIDIDGAGTGLGITPFSIGGRSIFGSYNAGGYDEFRVVKVKECPIDGIKIDDCTFNQFTAEMIIVDNTFGSTASRIDFLSFTRNEIDSAAGLTTGRLFKLSHVSNFKFDSNVCAGGGQRTAMGDLVDVYITADGNYVTGVDGAAFSLAADCYASIGLNRFNFGNTKGMISGAGGFPKYTWAAGANTIYPHRTAANQNGIHKFEVTAGTAWSITLPSTGTGYSVHGQVITLVIANTRASGLVDPPTLPANFKTAGAMTMPAAGNSRSWTFRCEFSSGNPFWYEISRSAADVSN